MSAIPQDVLSEAFAAHIEGSSLVAAVFLTFQFDPNFFEQEVLPVLLDEPVSHVDVVRVVQLEAALSRVPHRLAVYYDSNGLTSGAQPARLDIARIPVAHSTGVFHPKNVFALFESPPDDENPAPTRKLLVASMSANLTRSGWWENVECCHIERISADEPSRLRDDLRDFLRSLEKKVGLRAADDHESLRAIVDFLKTITPRKTRSTAQVLHTHFFDGTGRFVDFLERTAGRQLQGCNLEVISPYFDDARESAPLQALIDSLDIGEVRLFLPKTDAGEVKCNQDFFAWVQAHDSVSWARFPTDITRLGKHADAKHRFVHAKVYRFIGQAPMREYVFIGSVNLTTAAHNRGRNLESGFLVDANPSRTPDWWMEVDRTRPSGFVVATEDGDDANTLGSRLLLRFHWASKEAQALWSGSQSSPVLTVSRAGLEVLQVRDLAPEVWQTLDAGDSESLSIALKSTSILSVTGDRPEPATLLVQEEGMEHRPSLLLTLSPADILKYWTLLTNEQRAAFIEARAPELMGTEEGHALLSRQFGREQADSFFDKFAGIFLSFSELESTIRAALRAKTPRHKEVRYRLFGDKYDSLGHLLKRIQEDLETDPNRLVENYVMALCAKQLVRELARDFPEFWAAHASDGATLTSRVRLAEELRERLEDTDDASMKEFLPWFETWFLQRAKPVVAETRA